jgi:CBS domain containing-hemolysin-like protein
MTLLALVAAGVLLLLCAVFVAAEFSLVTVQRSQVEEQAARGEPGAKGVLAALRTLSTQLSAAQVGITVTNLGIGFLAEPAIADLLEGPLVSMGLGGSKDQISIVVALVLATALTMVLGELVPKNLAISAPLRTAALVSPVMRVFTAAGRPVVLACNLAANKLLRLVGVEVTEELASARSPEELATLVRHSAKEGSLEESTADLVERSLAFGDRRARDVMTARGQMTSVEHDDVVTSVLGLARSSGHSRFPVLEEGEAVGVVHVRHALSVPFNARGHARVSDVMEEPRVVPDTMPLDALLDVLRGQDAQLALVIDEFGGVAGLVTLEDLVEELVGSVRDEHDTEQAPEVDEDGHWRLPGTMRPDEASELLGVGVPAHEDYDTLAGLVVLHLERMPEVGDTVVVPAEVVHVRRERGIELTVLELDGHRVETLEVSLVATGDDS